MTQNDAAKSKVDDPENPGAERTEKDWGLKPAKRGMGWGTKIGLLMVLVTCGAFGYVVYKKVTLQSVEAAVATEVSEVAGEVKAIADGVTAGAEAPKLAETAGSTTPPSAGKSDDPFQEQGTQVAALPVQNEPLQNELLAGNAEEVDLDRLGGRPAKGAAPNKMTVPDQAEPAEPSLELAEAEPAKAPVAKMDASELLEPESTEPPAAGQPQLVMEPAKKAAATPAVETQSTPDLFPAAESAKTLEVETQPAETEAPALDAPTPLPKNPVASRGAAKESVTLEGLETIPDAEPAAQKPVGPKPATAETDARLGDYVVAPTSTRAVSKTVITRPESAGQATPIHPARPAAQLQGEIEVAAVDQTAETQLSQPQPINPPVAQPAPYQPESAPTTVIQRRVPTATSPAASPLTLTPIPQEPRPRQMTPISPAAFPGNGIERAPGREPSASIGGQTGESYTVVPNDNFWKISRKQYGTIRYFAALTQHNKNLISDPTHMRPGTQIATPSKEFLEATYPDLIESGSSRGESSNPVAVGGGLDSIPTTAEGEGVEQSGFFVSETGEPMYRVGPDDTLTGISQRHLGRSSRWPEILEQNRGTLKTPDALKIGTVIRLPANASRLSVAPGAKERR